MVSKVHILPLVKRLIMNKVFLLFSILLSSLYFSQGGDVPASERAELERIYNENNGEKWPKKEKWNSVSPVEEWEGISVVTNEKGEKHIETINLTSNQLTGVFSLANLPELKKIFLSSNQISGISLDKTLEKLSYLMIDDNNLEELHLENFQLLEQINVYSNANLATLSLNNLPKLKNIQAYSCKLNNVSLSSLGALETLSLHGNQISAIDLSPFTTLTHLYLAKNTFTTLNIRGLSQLKFLDIQENLKLTTLETGEHPELINFYASKSNELKGYIDLGKSAKLKIFHALHTKVEAVNLKNGNNKWMASKNSVLISDKVKCIAVDDPKAARNPSTPRNNPYKSKNWDIIWATGYTRENGFQDDCTNALSADEVGIQKNSFKVVSPVKETLWVQGVDGLKTIEIYAANGQLVKTISGNKANVSSLTKGLYFIKIFTDKGVLTSKIIKE